MKSWPFLMLSCGKVATINISQLFAVFQKLTRSISHVWGSSVVNEAAQEGPCALTSNTNVSTMLFKVSDWTRRHSSLVNLSQWLLSANLKEALLGSESLSQSRTQADFNRDLKSTSVDAWRLPSCKRWPRDSPLL